MKRFILVLSALALALSGLAPAATAQTTASVPTVELTVTIENLAPTNGTTQTPFWVGLHEGAFDMYDRGAPASQLPSSGSVAVERLAEDGNTGPITDDFALLSNGVDATVAGPNGPIAPGEVVSTTFTVDPSAADVRYFSYASMVLPSNDFFVANGNPQAHQVFDDTGQLVATDFFISGDQVLDAGTEVSDEIPANTAFFGQAAPNTGVDENGVVIGFPEGLTGFLPAGSGGILDGRRFASADFSAPGYPIARIGFDAVPVVTEDRNYQAVLNGGNEVPPVDTTARGRASYNLRGDGTVLRFRHDLFNLDNVVGAHLHLGAEGANGPAIAPLMAPAVPGGGPLTRLIGNLRADDLTGPLAGRSISALVAAIDAGNVYVNFHTGENPGGEIRGQLTPRG